MKIVVDQMPQHSYDCCFVVDNDGTWCCKLQPLSMNTVRYPCYGTCDLCIGGQCDQLIALRQTGSTHTLTDNQKIALTKRLCEVYHAEDNTCGYSGRQCTVCEAAQNEARRIYTFVREIYKCAEES